MRTYLRKAKQLLFSVKPYSYVANIEPTEKFQSASLSTDDSGQVLQIQFAEPIKDGNEIEQISLLTEGQTVYSDDLYPGETQCKVYFDGFDLDILSYSAVLIDSDGQVVEKTDIKINEIAGRS